MAGAGSVVSVSTRRSRPDDLERLARSRIARDGVTQLAAASSSGRQLRLLREVRDRLAADPALEVFGPSDHGDGISYVWAHPAGTRHAGVYGQPRGMADESPV